MKYSKRFLPNPISSLYSRLLLVIALAVGGSFILASGVWLSAIQTDKETDALLSVEDLATSMAQTVIYFEGLPRAYQHIILDQQRNLGGSRHFLSINSELIHYQPLSDNPLKTRLQEHYINSFTERVGKRVQALHVNFAYPQNLQVFNNEVYFSELPSRWVQNNLVLNPPAPLLVAQMQMKNGDWLYLASLMLPDPYVVEGIPTFTQDQFIFTVILALILMICSWFIVRWLTTPLRQLSRAARALGRDIHHPPLDEKGTFEVKETARAFNLMQKRILAFIGERNQLFSSISHDLKTPITRLRLRAELLDNAKLKSKFEQDLDELEHLVNGALELAKGNDLNEPIREFNLSKMLHAIQEEIDLLEKYVHLDLSKEILISASPLAIKRCLSNLIHNAVVYGNEAWVIVEDLPKYVTLTIDDSGPGIPDKDKIRVLDPFVRLEVSRSKATGGHGLGLSIARNIIHNHGGTLVLQDSPKGGLQVRVLLPKLDRM